MYLYVEYLSVSAVGIVSLKNSNIIFRKIKKKLEICNFFKKEILYSNLN